MTAVALLDQLVEMQLDLPSGGSSGSVCPNPLPKGDSVTGVLTSYPQSTREQDAPHQSRNVPRRKRRGMKEPVDKFVTRFSFAEGETSIWLCSARVDGGVFFL